MRVRVPPRVGYCRAVPRMRRRGAAGVAIAATLTLTATALGARALRVLALSPNGRVKLTFSARGHSASRAIAVG